MPQNPVKSAGPPVALSRRAGQNGVFSVYKRLQNIPPSLLFMATRKDAAKQIGVEPQTLAEWYKKPAKWFPFDAVRTDSKGRAVDWDVDRIIAARRTASAADDQVLAKQLQQVKVADAAETLKQKQAKTRKILRDEQLEEGNILPRDEWTLFAVESVNIARDQLKDVPKQLARLIDGEEMQMKFLEEGTRLIVGILARLAKTLEEGPNE